MLIQSSRVDDVGNNDVLRAIYLFSSLPYAIIDMSDDCHKDIFISSLNVRPTIITDRYCPYN